MKCEFPQGAVLVFGGSGGIGRDIVRQFGRSGSAIAIAYRSKNQVAEQLAAELSAGGVEVSIHQLDVRDAAAVNDGVAAAAETHGRLHTVLWAAGPVVPQLYVGQWSDEQYRDAMEIEAFGFFNAVRAALPHFRANSGGSFVHLGSSGHVWWPKRDGLSVVPKASNEALVKGVAKEEGRYGIRANSILVGVIESGQFPLGKSEGYFDERWELETMRLLALKHYGSSSDIASAAIFLASDQARYITGQTLSVSGGFGV